MRVLVACEFSGVVRRAFEAKGHQAYSADILPAEDDSPNHIKGNCLDVLEDDWDLVIAHPPCTYLASSGARWWFEKREEQTKAILFFLRFHGLSVPCAIENPIGILSTVVRKPDQIIQPWMFGHGETKATCLWLNKLPPLIPTEIVDGRHPRVHLESPGPERWKNRSRTYAGIAAAMADQWG